MATVPEDIELTAAQKERLAKLADQTGKPWDAVLVEALATYEPKADAASANGSESFYDAAARHGLIGCVQGGPPDLSTNPKYMVGFGEPWQPPCGPQPPSKLHGQP